MTLKLIAIGLLALLGLSSVMKPQPFRVFLGLLGAVCMVLFVSFLVARKNPESAQRSGEGRVLTQVNDFLGQRPDWKESAEAVSERVLEDLEQGKVESYGSAPEANPPETDPPANDPESIKPPSPRARIDRVHVPLNVLKIKSTSKEQRKVELVTAMQDWINEYLTLYRTRNPLDPGVELLSHSDIDPQIIGQLRFKISTRDDMVLLTPKFDERFEAFVRHVRKQGRKAITRIRMEQTAIVSCATIAVLFIAYGLLKAMNGRKPQQVEDDFLTRSNVSMV